MQEFNDNIDGLYSLFHDKTDTVTLYTKKVEEICSEALVDSNIRHPPITSRIKSWESAKGSISRRVQERLVRRDLRQAVEAQGRSWEDYTRETGLNSFKDEMDPLTTPTDMLAALHDFGGIRISLYFPGDLERVTTALEGRFDIVRQINKGIGPQSNLQALKERLEFFQDPEKAKKVTDASGQFQTPTRLFTGYRATHFILKLREEDIPPNRTFSWKEMVVEIQVGTLVMHVWSEIEHDMIYKPLSSQGERISEDEERILDLINGIVLTGEAALRQLEASTAKRLDKRAKDNDTKASSYFELATWIERDCEERNVALVGSEWKLLEQLFDILKAAGAHKHSKVITLIEYGTQQTSSRQLLPTFMLQALCNQPVCVEWQPSSQFTLLGLVQHARLLALRLVHTLNIAIYFGASEGLLDAIKRGIKSGAVPSPPSMALLLDILHPFVPRYSNPDAAEKITTFCAAVLHFVGSPESKSSDLVKLAVDLPATTLVGMLANSDGSQLVPVPGIINQILPMVEDASEVENSGDLYQTLGFIEFYLSLEGTRDDKLLVWNRLSARSVDSKEPERTPHFVPVAPTNKDLFGRWRLADHISLMVQKLSPEDLRENPNPIQRLELASFPEGPSIDSFAAGEQKAPGGILKLAYHLHPKEHWRAIQKAFGISRVIRLRNPPLERKIDPDRSHASDGVYTSELTNDSQDSISGRRHASFMSSLRTGGNTMSTKSWIRMFERPAR